MIFTKIASRLSFVLMLAILCTPLTVQAEKTAANADFISFGADGCTDIEVNLFVKRGKLKKKLGSEKARVTLSLSKIDTCKGRVLVSAEAKNIKLKSKEFTFKNGKALLDASIEMLNRQTKNKFTVDVVVQWIANQPPIIADVTRDMTAPGRFVALKAKARKTLYLANAFGSISSGNNVFIKGEAEEASFMVTH